MRGLAFSFTCPRCGSCSSRLVNQCRRGGGNTGRDGVGSTTELVGVVACCECRREYSITVHLRQLASAEQRANRDKQRARRKRVAA